MIGDLRRRGHRHPGGAREHGGDGEDRAWHASIRVDDAIIPGAD